MKKILVIGDTQVKPGISLDYLKFIGEYLIEKEPDIVVHLGDHWDMPSLSSYDIGKKSFEGRRYLDDVNAGNEGMRVLLQPLKDKQEQQRKNAKKIYRPKLVYLFGNHCQRIERAVENDAKIEGVIGHKDLYLEDWEQHKFLEVVTIEGIAFSHYFTSGVLGRPCTSASALLAKKHQSCIAGHQQGLQFATTNRADGARLTACICGSSYEHDESYLGPQGNKHFRGILMLHEVTGDGSFDIMPVSMTYLRNKYAV
jgi:Calcineurin-like phosphoesterase